MNTVPRHFYAVSFKLSVKTKTGKSERVGDKTCKVVNLISTCASIISMDISTDLSLDIHIHGKPELMIKNFKTSWKCRNLDHTDQLYSWRLLWIM